jgi:hypothetical protein
MHPENVEVFMNKIKPWLKEYRLNPQPKTIIEMNLEYLNSSSLKALLYDFAKFKDTKTEITIIWYYYDEDSKEQAFEFEEVTKGKVILKQV